METYSNEPADCMFMCSPEMQHDKAQYKNKIGNEKRTANDSYLGD